jgi:hypothetical protein
VDPSHSPPTQSTTGESPSRDLEPLLLPEPLQCSSRIGNLIRIMGCEGLELKCLHDSQLNFVCETSQRPSMILHKFHVARLTEQAHTSSAMRHTHLNIQDERNIRFSSVSDSPNLLISPTLASSYNFIVQPTPPHHTGYIHDRGGLFSSAGFSHQVKYLLKTFILTKYMSIISRGVIFEEKKTPAATLHNIAQGL